MFLTETVAHFFDFIFPQQCNACWASFEGGSLLCDPCGRQFADLMDAPACARCAMPVSEPGAPCPHCLDHGVHPYDRIAALGVLQHPLKSIVHRAKYSWRWQLADWLADCALERPDIAEMLSNADCIVPVPLHRRRQIQRGYNQSDLIAARLSQRTKIPLIAAAHRIRNTPTQTNLHTRAGRLENLRGAFVLSNPSAIHGKHVIVIDDVLTTGATLVSLGRSLKPAEPASISAIVMAVADPKGRSFEVI